MSEKDFDYNWGELESDDESGQITDSIRLMELIAGDYKIAREQLESLGRTLGEREALVTRKISGVKGSSQNTSCLCLLPYQSKTSRNQLGTAMLGIIGRNRAATEPTRLEVHCFDGFQVSFDGKKIEHWESIKSKSLLQYLMTKPRKRIAKEELMEALWPDCDPKVSGNNLKAAMHGLRQTFSKLSDKEQSVPYIIFNQGTYQINPKMPLWFDVEQFELYWEKGRQLQVQGKTNDAMREYKLAEELYKGDYLADDPYEDWTILRRETLHDIYLNILSKLADSYLQTTDYENCIAYCFKILDKDSCREDAYQRLICCYSRLGLRNRALQWYEICRKAIAAELDTEPDEKTNCLYQQLVKNNKPL